MRLASIPGLVCWVEKGDHKSGAYVLEEYRERMVCPHSSPSGLFHTLRAPCLHPMDRDG